MILSSTPQEPTGASRQPDFGSVQTQGCSPHGLVDRWGRGRQAGCPTGLGPDYLEARELLWDGAEEEEVAALSWEKRLEQDSRLDMEPLERKETHVASWW